MSLVQKEPKKITMGTPPRLPAEYQEVEYIESSGTQWIDTGLYWNLNKKFILDSKRSSTLQYGLVFGANSLGGEQLYVRDQNRTFLNGSAVYGVSAPSSNVRHIIEWNTTSGNAYIKLDGTTVASNNGTSTNNRKLTLFGTYETSNTQTPTGYSTKIYSFQGYDMPNNELVRDMIPCYRKNDDVIGMYDLVNNVFYTNQGSGTFTKGPDINFVEQEIKRVTIRPNGTEKQIRPVSQPITTIGIYWSESLGVISFQTSNGVGISIADKNLGATQVYNSGDTLSFANMGYGYQWGNNYGWAYGVDPVNTTTTQVNASTYGPGNYYSSSTFIIAYNVEVSWDSSDNANLWGGTTNTYAARQGPAPEGWHIPSKADAQTLVDAISSITGSVNVSKINQYCKLPSVIPGISRTTGTWENEPWGGIRYSDAYSSQSGGMLYLPTSGNYVVNENSRKSEALPLRPFSNTFIQPDTSRTQLN